MAYTAMRLLPILVLAWLSCCGAKPISSLVVFGDSIASNAICDSWQGPLWSRYAFMEAGGINWPLKVAADAEIRLRNYAVGGAALCPGFPQATTNFSAQIDSFVADLEDVPLTPGEAAVVVALGTNDWLYTYLLAITDAKDVKPEELFPQVLFGLPVCMAAGLARLQALPQLKGSTIYVATLEAMEHLPLAKQLLNGTELADLVKLVDATNDAFRAVAANMSTSDTKIKVWEQTAELRKAFKKLPSPIKHAGACLTRDGDKEIMCEDVRQCAFFEDVHYSSMFHNKVFAKSMTKLLRKDKLVKLCPSI